MDKLQILLVADGRSPITRNWIRMARSIGCAVHLASTYPYQPIAGLESQTTIAVGFSSFAGGQIQTGSQPSRSLKKQAVSALRPLLMRLRAELAPRFMRKAQEELRAFAISCQPDIVHALRIPFEGMLCAALPASLPLVVSIWGNDLTLHAGTSNAMRKLTLRTLNRADGLLADAARDITLAQTMGLRRDVPVDVVPGSGGLDLAEIDASRKRAAATLEHYKIPAGRPLVINPRGFRPGSVHQDTFFQSIPLVLKKHPEAYFICPGMAGQAAAENWVKLLGISGSVALLPYIQQAELWALYAASTIYISLSSHDGTPNSFLEAAACGCYPVVGDIASLREWILPSENGTLVDPRDAQAAAQALCSVINDERLRASAAQKNRMMVAERADRVVVGEKVARFYQRLI